MDYRLILIVILIVVLLSLCLNCVFKEQFQAELERITKSSISEKEDEEYEEYDVSPINTLDDILNLYPIIEGKDTTSNKSNENSEGDIIHKVTEPQQTLGVTHVLQRDYAKYDPIGFDGHHNYTRALNYQ